LPVRQRQVDGKLFSQIAHLTGAEPNLARLQFLVRQGRRCDEMMKYESRASL
jgi:hypothetical protein